MVKAYRDVCHHRRQNKKDFHGKHNQNNNNSNDLITPAE